MNETHACAIYVHIPFCPTKCGYCDFNSYALDGEIIERTTDAILSDIRSSPHFGRPAKTIFFGGGTPTFIPAEQLIGILKVLMDAHPPVGDCEITSEANPGTVDASRFEAMAEAGFNRISLGAQSFFADDLVRLGRIHSTSEITTAFASARSAGFKNLNLDLMFALPEQSLGNWRRNLEVAMNLDPEHISLYCLTIEPNTAFFKQHRRGMLSVPCEERQIAMYDLCSEAVARHGFRQYEISNYAKPGYECRHNLCYWRGEEYIAYGPGAVERVGMRRTTRLKHPQRYCEAVEAKQNLFCDVDELDESSLRSEKVMLGLRLEEGVDHSIFEPDAVRELGQRGWVELSPRGRVRLTKKGRHFCNQAIVELL